MKAAEIHYTNEQLRKHIAQQSECILGLRSELSRMQSRLYEARRERDVLRENMRVLQEIGGGYQPLPRASHTSIPAGAE